MQEPFPPFTIGENGKRAESGLVLDLLEQVFGRLGMRVRLDLAPFARALKTAEHGRADGMPLLVKTQERERYMAFTQEVFRSREWFHCVPNNLNRPLVWSSFEDLKGLRIGLVRGYSYGEEFLAAVESVPLAVEMSTNLETNFRKLAKGRLDLVLEDEIIARVVLAAHPQWRISIRTMWPPVSTYAWHMGLSRASGAAELLPQVDRVLSDMKATGEIDRILKAPAQGAY